MTRKFTGTATWILLLAFTAAVLLAGCGGPAPASPPPAAPQAAAAPAAKPTAEWKADGIISEGEYGPAQKIGDIEVYARVEGDSVMIAMKAQTKGWLALGIDPEDKMKGADIILGYIKDGKAVVEDMYSTGTFGPHPPDDRQSGTSDITMIGGSQKDGVTIIEFKRKLVTGDSKDKELKLGENKVIWAIGDVADSAAKHGRRGYGTLVLK